MIVGTFNNQNIIALPSSPSPQTVEWTATSITTANTNPFTGSQQVIDWQTSYLEATIQMPPMPDALARQWVAFLLETRQSNVFLFGDPLASLPLGTGAGTPVVSGANQTGYTLSTSGWSGANALLPGDWLQIGNRLYRNLDTVSTSTATLNIWPQLRESPADGTPIITTNTQGLFRLASNQSKWSQTEMRVYGLTFLIREAI